MPTVGDLPDTAYCLRCVPDDALDGFDPIWTPGNAPGWVNWAVGPYPLDGDQYAWITDDDSWAPVYFTAQPVSVESRARLFQVIDGVEYYLTPEKNEVSSYLLWKPDAADNLNLYVYSHNGPPLEDEPLKLYGIIHQPGSDKGQGGPLSRYVLGGYLLAGDEGDTQDVSFIAVQSSK